jgi:hypothetical protein
VIRFRRVLHPHEESEAERRRQHGATPGFMGEA